MTQYIHMRPSFGPRLARIFAGAAVIAVIAGCNTDKILSVTDPDVALPSALTGAAALPTLRAGAIGDFGAAFDGPTGDVEQVTLAGLLSDELVNTETFPTRIEIDQRAMTLSNTSLTPVFYDINRARASAQRAIAAFQANAKTASDSTGYPEVLALSGMTYVLLAENYCSGVPYSTLNADGSFTFGGPMTTNNMLDSAIAKFNAALAVTGSAKSATFTNLASIGLGRALLDEGNYAAAATAVASVPANFQYTYAHSATSSRQNNGTWSLTVSVARFGEANNEGTNGLPFQSDGNVKVAPIPDYRVADSLNHSGTKPGFGFDGVTVNYTQMKYPALTSPDVIADGVEGQLIQAEAMLQAGNPSGALTILNGLRANASVFAARGYPASASLPPLTLQATTAAQVDQLFKERAYWLFLTSHRVGDLRRLIRQYNRGAETVFPTGPYAKGGLYGADVSVPVPQAEQNNPNYQASACDPTKP
jgi:hypothetical protein